MESPPSALRSTIGNGRRRLSHRSRDAGRSPARPSRSWSDCVYVFHRDGHRLVDYRKAFRAACRAAGFSGLVPHDLRRSGARNAVRSGVPERVVMDLGGWRTRSVFDRYNITSEADLADAVERISEYVSERGVERPKVEPLPAQSGSFRSSAIN